MHPKLSNLILGLIIVLGIIGLILYRKPPVSDIESETAVRSQITQFGESLKMVSLLAPTSTVSTSMTNAYSAFVAPELLNTWKNDPTHSPGRLTSSPYPDRIDIASAYRTSASAYTVEGQVVEVSSGDVTGSNSGTYPVKINLEKRNNTWLITSLSGYPPSE